MKRLLLSLLPTLLTGCVLRQSPALESYDALGPEHAGQIRELASAVSERISVRYPQELVYVDEPRGRGMFGDVLRYALGQSNALAIREELAGVSLVYALGELSPGQGYLNLRFSDGTAMAQSFALDTPEPTSPAIAGGERTTVAVTPLGAPTEKGTENQAMSGAQTPLASASSLAFDSKEERELPPSPLPAPTTGGQNRPLRLAVLSRLPPAWKYTIPDASKREIRVSWPEGYGWRESIEFAAGQAGCRAEFDELARRVTIRTANVPLPAEAVAVAAISSSPAPATDENPPVVSAALATLPVSSVGPKLTALSSTPADTWELRPGSLETQLGEWCASAGWQLLWKADHDILLQAHSIQHGEFERAVTDVFHALHIQGNSLRATLYKTNSVLEIKDN